MKLKRILELREFQGITYNSEYKDDVKYKYLNKVDFDELEAFMLSFKNNEASEVGDFLNISYKKAVGKVISAKNYVGLIELSSGLQLQILPKVINSDNNAVKRVLLSML